MRILLQIELTQQEVEFRPAKFHDNKIIDNIRSIMKKYNFTFEDNVYNTRFKIEDNWNKFYILLNEFIEHYDFEFIKSFYIFKFIKKSQDKYFFKCNNKTICDRFKLNCDNSIFNKSFIIDTSLYQFSDYFEKALKCFFKPEVKKKLILK